MSTTDTTKPTDTLANPSPQNKHEVEICRVQVRLPPYFPNSINTWFIQVESQFSLCHVTSDITKYNYIISGLPQDVAESLIDVFENPPKTDLYENLKKTILNRHSLSIETRIKKLISDEEIGDNKPSEFYRRLKTLAGNSGTVGHELIKTLWLSRLPNLINIALIPQSDQNFEKILETADKIHESIQHSSQVSIVNSATSFHNQSKQITSSQNDSQFRLSKLEKEISSLKKMIQTMGHNTKSKSRSNSRQRCNSSDRSNKRVCWYHHKFGNKAQKCIPPCDLSKSNTSASTSNFNTRNSKN